MKTKTLIIITASVLALGGLVGLAHSNSCPLKDVRPCQMFSK